MEVDELFTESAPLRGAGPIRDAQSIGSLLSGLTRGGSSTGPSVGISNHQVVSSLPPPPSSSLARPTMAEGSAAGRLTKGGGALLVARSVGSLLSGLLRGAGASSLATQSSSYATPQPSSSSAPQSSSLTFPVAEKLPIVCGPERAIVRAKKLPAIPLRRSAQDKVAYEQYMADVALMHAAADECDCGCALHEFGCFHAPVTSLSVRQRLDLLVALRHNRLTTAFDTLAPKKLQELADCLVTLPCGTVQCFEFVVLKVKVCFAVKCWAEGYPRATMQRMCGAAAEGRVKTRSQIKREGGAPSVPAGVGAANVRVHARAYITDEVTTAAEQQPNTQPYENIAGDVQLSSHVGPFVPCCMTCQRAVTEKKDEAATEEAPECSHALCSGICRYSEYASSSIALGEPFAKPPLFRLLYASVMQELEVSVRRHKGVSSECETCRVNNAIVAMAADARTDEQLDTALHNLAVHRVVIERWRGEERAA